VPQYGAELDRLFAESLRSAEQPVLSASPAFAPNKELQAEWNAQGEEAFEFAILETLPDDTASLNLSDLLAERKQAWIAQTGA
jgi:hypothetical protein